MTALPKWTVITLSIWFTACAHASPPLLLIPTTTEYTPPPTDNTPCATSPLSVPQGYADIRTWTAETAQAYIDSNANCLTGDSGVCDAPLKITLAWALWRIGTPEHRRKAYKLTESLQHSTTVSAEAHLLSDILAAHQRDEQHIERLQNLLRGQQRQTRELSRTLEKLKAIEHSLIDKTAPIPQVLPAP